MDRALTVKRRLILVGLVILLAGDFALGAYSWHTANSLRKPMTALVADSRKLQLLRIDVDNADRIRHDLPTTVACDRFEASLLPASTGNSAITAELDDLSKKAGLQIQSLAFRHKEIAARNLTQVELEISVNGPYANIVKFMNSLQRSKNPYAVDSVVLQTGGAQSAPNDLHIGLHMKTFFRTAA
jgi:type II secretion system (T2SS) protein M